MSYGLYAAERLISAGLDAEGGRAYVLKRARAGHWRAPTEAYLLRSLLTGMPDTRGEPRRRAHQRNRGGGSNPRAG